MLFSNIALFSQVAGDQLKVQGESVISATPEEMVVNIPILVKDSLYSKCSDQLMAKYNDLVSDLNKNGIKKEIVKTDRMQITENYKWSSEGQKFDGYAGTINVLIELKYDVLTLNKIIKTLSGKDMKLTYNVQFQLSKEQRETLLQKSIENAIGDATNKANIISKSLGLKLIGVKDVNFGYVSSGNEVLAPMYKMRMSVSDSRGPEASINELNPQEIDISKSIGIIWYIGK